MERYGLHQQLKEGCVLFIPGVVNGTTAYDASGNSNHLTVNGSLPSVRRYGYKGFKGTGNSSQYLSSSSSAFNITNNITIATRFKTSSTGYQGIVIKHQSNNLGGYLNYSINANFYQAGDIACRFQVSPGSFVDPRTPTGTYSDGKFHTAVATFSSGTAKLYVDGVLVDTRAGGSSIYNDWGNLEIYGSIFNNGGPYNMDGEGFNAGIWNKAFSQDEVSLYHLSFFIP